MPIQVTCSSCSSRLRLRDAAAGKMVKCPKCQAVIAVPAPTKSGAIAEEVVLIQNRIFVSHSSRDAALVEGELLPILREAGLEPWYSSDDIRALDEWERKIQHGLRSSPWFCVVLTPQSVGSKWVKAEVDWATENRDGKILVIFAEECDKDDLHLLLRRIQHVDFRGDRQLARKKMLESLASLCSRPQQVPTVTAQPPAKPVTTASIFQRVLSLKQSDDQARQAHAKARRMAAGGRFGEALQALHEIDESRRDAGLFQDLSRQQQRVEELEERMQAETNLCVLGRQITELIHLQPLRRDELQAVLEALPPAARLADVLAIPLDRSGKTKLPMKLILPGDFLMGSHNSDDIAQDDEKPEHKVRITTPFYLGMHPVTQAQYQAMMGNNPSYFKGDARPVEQTSWDDAVAFCQKLTQHVQGTELIPDGWWLTLPSEAQWEYACRAGTTSRYSFGDDPNMLGEFAWFDKNSDHQTHNVGQRKPNPWGLYDMHGNVWEWCQDYFAGDYYQQFASAIAVDPQGPSSGDRHVLRGGSWFFNPRFARSAVRDWYSSDFRYYTLGFRVVCWLGSRTP